MEATTLKRVFNYNGNQLSDIDPKMSPSAILKFHSNEHPELLNASIDAGDIKEDGCLHFEVKTNIGTKG